MTKVNVQTAKDLGLLPEEYDQIIKILGRTPNFTELSAYAAMWSEHCSYKNSIAEIKKLPREGKSLLAKGGEENAGLVDIGDNLAVAFKIESHNHPSAIEPYQGAATGVGGIHRDIFTMGARPVASLNALRFGSLDDNKTRRLLRGVVKGIGDYGNSFGVPTVGGEVTFDSNYHVNPLVNAMSVGIVDADNTVSATSEGPGNPVYIVGSATGKDGIHGAVFASGDITEDSEDDLPSVQVGDPFQEKLLLEATLEAIQTGAVVGMQDMGAAGIICSTSEMSEKDGHGMKVWLDKVPVRQSNMKPFEILLSESQERMLVVVKKGREQDIEAVFDKWDLNCAIIGEVTEGNQLEFYSGENKIANIPADSLVLGGGAPVYYRDAAEPAYFDKIRQFNASEIKEPANPEEVACFLIKHPNMADRQWISEQYDSMVQINNTNTNNPSDASVIHIKGTGKGLAITTDCNTYFTYADPRRGTALAVTEAARNIVCSGGKPMAISNCLNFGNPYDKEVYWQFKEAIQGMKEACEKFETPVTGGNVSFYNHSPDGGAVFPTPTIAMVGLLNDINAKMTLHFRQAGDVIYQLGDSRDDIYSSQYLIHWHGIRHSPLPWFDIDAEYRLQQTVLKLIEKQWIKSAHDISEGGLFNCLIEKGMVNNLGFNVSNIKDIRSDAFMFGEAQGRIIVTVDAELAGAFEDELSRNKQPCERLGEVTDGEIKVADKLFKNDIRAFASMKTEALGALAEQ